MLRIAICCGGGLSSSVLARHLEKDIHEMHLEDRASFIFIPISHLLDRMNEVDIALCCPHTEYKLRQNVDKYTIPTAIIPPRLYGLVSATYLVEDAEDLYALWQKGRKNIVTFDDEPRPLAVRRTTSHRRYLKGETLNPAYLSINKE